MPSLLSFRNLTRNRHVLIIWNSLQKYLGKGEKAEKVPRTGYTQTLILRPSPWKFWPGSLQSPSDAKCTSLNLLESKSAAAGGIRTNPASMPTWQRALAVLCSPNRACSESSGGKGTEGAQQSPSCCWAILSGLPGAPTANLENSIHPLPAGKRLLCISALSWLPSRHQAGC